MGEIIYGETDRLMAWAGPANDAGVIAPDTTAIGYEVDGTLRAVVYFCNFTTTNCSMHVVSDKRGNWLTRGYLAAAFAYPFIQLKLNRVTALVASRNLAAMVLDLKLGFQVEGKMIEAAEDDDIVVLGMLRKHCKWISEDKRNG